jgi:hypothetical protein
MQHEGVHGLCRPEPGTYGASAAQSAQGRHYIRIIPLETCESRGYVPTDAIRQDRTRLVSGYVATVDLSQSVHAPRFQSARA